MRHRVFIEHLPLAVDCTLAAQWQDVFSALWPYYRTFETTLTFPVSGFVRTLQCSTGTKRFPIPQQ